MYILIFISENWKCFLWMVFAAEIRRKWSLSKINKEGPLRIISTINLWKTSEWNNLKINLKKIVYNYLFNGDISKLLRTALIGTPAIFHKNIRPLVVTHVTSAFSLLSLCGGAGRLRTGRAREPSVLKMWIVASLQTIKTRFPPHTTPTVDHSGLNSVSGWTFSKTSSNFSVRFL